MSPFLGDPHIYDLEKHHDRVVIRGWEVGSRADAIGHARLSCSMNVGLLYYTLHSVMYEGELYSTALHLFEVPKLLPDWPDLADCYQEARACKEGDMMNWQSSHGRRGFSSSENVA